MVVHGWLEGFRLGTLWVNTTILNLLKHRGGCVFFMDYSKYSYTYNYFALTPHFNGISNVLLKKFKQIGNYERMYGFGFSFGSWLLSETGKKLGNQLIDRMDLCDTASELNLKLFSESFQ
jgi:predicted esterase